MSAYNDGGVLGFGPGFTLLMGLPPLTPSAIARKMSISTISLLPTTFTLTPFIFRLLRGVTPNYLEAKNLGQTHISRETRLKKTIELGTAISDEGCSVW